MGPIGVQEMVVIFLVALVLFGPKKLPELAKTIGKAVTEFRRAQSDLKATFEREMQSIERENEALKEVTRQTAAELTSYSDIDLGGGLPSAYETSTHGAVSELNPEHPTVSASAVPGAESHAEPQDTSYSYHNDAILEASPGVEGTVPRSASGAAQAGVAETASQSHSNPLPEFEQARDGGSAKTADSELPSIV